MSSRNPFAPSRATLDGGTAAPRAKGDSAVWRDGRVAVLLPDATLPRRCVKCNEPAHDPTKTRKVFWHSPWLYLLLLFNFIIFAIVALVVRKKALIAPGLCAEHKKRRRNALIVGWFGSLGGFVALTVGASSALGVWGALMGLFITIGSIIVGMVYGRIVYASKIDGEHVRLKGCGEPFLGSLPDFPG